MERSATERISPKAAITLIVQDLKSYNELNTIQKAIKERQQDLEVLNIAVEQTQQAYRSLVDLKSKGISDTEIIELNNLINSLRAAGGSSQNNGLNLRLDLASPNGKNNLQQPVATNSSNNSGPGSSNAGVGYGVNISTAQMIKLNLLKSTTSNMLNRIGTPHMPFSLHF